MKINITLFVQIFNFYIAYKIISNLFLKPILQLINKEDTEQKELIDEVATQSESLALKKLYKQELWKECQHQFMKMKPSVFNFYQEKIDTRSISPINTSDININDKLIEGMIEVLKEKITNDN